MLLLGLLLPVAVALPAQNYVNTAISRTVELGGAIARVTTQYNVKALVDAPGPYHLALAGKGDDVPAYWEATVGGKTVDGAVATEE